MDQKNISTLERFYINLINLFQLIEQITSKYSDGIVKMIPLVVKYIEMWNEEQKKTALEAFIKSTHLYWEKEIYYKKIEFFKEKQISLFPQLSQYTESINNIISKSPSEDQEVVWEYVHAFVKQSIKFIHEERLPTHVISNNRYQKAYTKDYFEKIPLSKHASQWGVVLEWK